MSTPTAPSAQGSEAYSPTKPRRRSTAEVLAASAELEEALVSPTSDHVHHHHHHHHNGSSSAAAVVDEQGAERARTATDAWKPALDRRQSWDREQQKRSLQMSSIADVKTGPGFSERGTAQ